jgi:hypothetical protein
MPLDRAIASNAISQASLMLRRAGVPFKGTPAASANRPIYPPPSPLLLRRLLDDSWSQWEQIRRHARGCSFWPRGNGDVDRAGLGREGEAHGGIFHLCTFSDKRGKVTLLLHPLHPIPPSLCLLRRHEKASKGCLTPPRPGCSCAAASSSCSPCSLIATRAKLRVSVTVLYQSRL